MNQHGQYVAVVDNNGDCVITIETTANKPWIVSQISAAMETAPSGATAVLRHNGMFVSFCVPTGDALGGDPPVTLHPGDKLTVEWSLCTPQDTATAFVIYEQIEYGQ